MKMNFNIGDKVYVKSKCITGIVANVYDERKPVLYLVKFENGRYDTTGQDNLVKMEDETRDNGITKDDFVHAANRVMCKITENGIDDRYNMFITTLLLTYAADLGRELFPNA